MSGDGNQGGPRFTLIHEAPVVKIRHDKAARKATDVEWIDLTDGTQRLTEADLVVLSAFQLQNVHLLMASDIGEIYDPRTGRGTIGRNFNYQTLSSSRVLLDGSRHTSQFVGAGGGGRGHRRLYRSQSGSRQARLHRRQRRPGQPIGGKPVAAALASNGGQERRGWGTGFKADLQDEYRHSFSIEAHGSNMTYRDACLDLDPAWKNAYGQPLMRMTFDWHDNDIRMNRHVVGKIGRIAERLSPHRTQMNALTAPFDVSSYKTTHLGGGAVMGDDPRTSAVNRYLQSLDAHNWFVIGSGAFPHDMTYNPTGLVAALSYWSAHHIKSQYLRSPGFLQ